MDDMPKVMQSFFYGQVELFIMIKFNDCGSHVALSMCRRAEMDTENELLLF